MPSRSPALSRLARLSAPRVVARRGAGRERPRRVHAPGRRQARRQLEEAAAVRLRRARAVRPARARRAMPLWGERRDYTWFIRDGFFVRSPVKFNGVTIGDAERRKFEADYLKQAQEREKRAPRGGSVALDGSGGSSIRQRTPRRSRRRPTLAQDVGGVHPPDAPAAASSRPPTSCASSSRKASTRSSAARRSTAATC